MAKFFRRFVNSTQPTRDYKTSAKHETWSPVTKKIKHLKNLWSFPMSQSDLFDEKKKNSHISFSMTWRRLYLVKKVSSNKFINSHSCELFVLWKENKQNPAVVGNKDLILKTNLPFPLCVVCVFVLTRSDFPSIHDDDERPAQEEETCTWTSTDSENCIEMIQWDSCFCFPFFVLNTLLAAPAKIIHFQNHFPCASLAFHVDPSLTPTGLLPLQHNERYISVVIFHSSSFERGMAFKHINGNSAYIVGRWGNCMHSTPVACSYWKFVTHIWSKSAERITNTQDK